ncbi:MAG: hypothetical protein K6G63_08160 [Eubacterium sp.]|nr:hypothetical protein [Eubacterium sp.]
MNKQQSELMRENFIKNISSISGKEVYVFGHCESSLSLIDLMYENGIKAHGILDNNPQKAGIMYNGVKVIKPEVVLKKDREVVVLVVSRFYEAMKKQLRDLGFNGDIIKLLNYNKFSEYSLDEKVIERMKKLIEDGKETLRMLKDKYPGSFFVFCPFAALGDIYLCNSYLPLFQKKTEKDNCIIVVPSEGCAKIVELFGNRYEVMSQDKLDDAAQAAIYTKDKDTFIAHHDRPYVINLHRALYIKKISLEQIYCCGVFGLPKDTKPVKPTNWRTWKNLNEIQVGRAVIIAPYAKSVIPIKDEIWTRIVRIYKKRGFQVFTNTAPGEEPLRGTEALVAQLDEMKSIVERAGTFIGIRSGLCDVLRTANCRKIALYPDYNYCDTKWKAIDIYWLEEFENIEVKDDVEWKMIK